MLPIVFYPVVANKLKTKNMLKPTTMSAANVSKLESVAIINFIDETKTIEYRMFLYFEYSLLTFHSIVSLFVGFDVLQSEPMCESNVLYYFRAFIRTFTGSFPSVDDAWCMNFELSPCAYVVCIRNWQKHYGIDTWISVLIFVISSRFFVDFVWFFFTCTNGPDRNEK